MPITIFSPHNGTPVKVRDQDAGRAVKDDEGRIFYVLPKSDGSGYYGALTRSGNPKEEARAKELENKVAVARGETRAQVELALTPQHKDGSWRGKVLVGSAIAVVVVMVYLFTIGPFNAKSLFQPSAYAPPPPKQIPVDVIKPSPAQLNPNTDPASSHLGQPVPDAQDPTFMVLPSGLKYKIDKPGQGDPARIDDQVEIRYTGWLSSGKEFDTNTTDPDGFTLTIGATRNLHFWNQALQGMTTGEVRTLIVPPDLAYGSQGNPIVPPNETLKYQVELVHIIHR